MGKVVEKAAEKAAGTAVLLGSGALAVYGVIKYLQNKLPKLPDLIIEPLQPYIDATNEMITKLKKAWNEAKTRWALPVQNIDAGNVAKTLGIFNSIAGYVISDQLNISFTGVSNELITSVLASINASSKTLVAQYNAEQQRITNETNVQIESLIAEYDAKINIITTEAEFNTYQKEFNAKYASILSKYDADISALNDKFKMKFDNLFSMTTTATTDITTISAYKLESFDILYANVLYTIVYNKPDALQLSLTQTVLYSNYRALLSAMLSNVKNTNITALSTQKTSDIYNYYSAIIKYEDMIRNENNKLLSNGISINTSLLNVASSQYMSNAFSYYRSALKTLQGGL